MTIKTIEDFASFFQLDILDREVRDYIHHSQIVLRFKDQKIQDLEEKLEKLMTSHSGMQAIQLELEKVTETYFTQQKDLKKANQKIEELSTQCMYFMKNKEVFFHKKEAVLRLEKEIENIQHMVSSVEGILQGLDDIMNDECEDNILENN